VVPPEVFAQLRSDLGGDDDDAIIMVWGPRQDVVTAIEEVAARAREALIGVPSETRQAFADGTTGFERLLPGPERMYPDTDTPPIPIPDRWLHEVDARRPEAPWVREDRWVAAGLPRAMAQRLGDAPWADLYDELAPRTELGRRRLAAALERRLVHHWRSTGTRTLPAADRLRPLVEAVDERRLRPEAYDEVFDALLEGTDDPLPAYVERDAAAGLQQALAALRTRAETELPRDPEARRRWALGVLMPGLRGTVDPAQAWTQAQTVLAAGIEEGGR
jgi:Glu-tRNA(Gln) amidotransferase subunit E-like FAD-binding protein